nr:hypothetical protein Itr_chr01CG18660 [Ipomoea trifida]
MPTELYDRSSEMLSERKSDEGSTDTATTAIRLTPARWSKDRTVGESPIERVDGGGGNYVVIIYGMGKLVGVKLRISIILFGL